MSPSGSKGVVIGGNTPSRERDSLAFNCDLHNPIATKIYGTITA
jgi:hypothetical protein